MIAKLVVVALPANKLFVLVVLAFAVIAFEVVALTELNIGLLENA